MTARDRAGASMAATELRRGTRPEVRRLARRMLDQLQAEIRRMDAWRRAWSSRGRSALTARSRAGG